MQLQVPRSVLWSVTAALLAGAPAATAGILHPAVRAQIDAAGPHELLSVIVNMEAQAPIAQLNADLRIQGASRAQRSRRVLDALQSVRSTQDALRVELDAAVLSGSVAGYTSYWVSNLMVIEAEPAMIEQIAARPDVASVEPNFSVTLIEPVGRPQMGGQDELGEPHGAGAGDGGGPRGIGLAPGVRAINADQVWHQLGYTGAGRVVANMDTGVDGNHPALNTRWRGFGGANPWQECWLDVLGTNSQFPNDGNSHGTHVMGTITGLGAATQDSIGVAPGAQWIASNAINQGVGGGFDNDVIASFQWLMNPDGNVNTVDDVPDVVQNSWRINEGFGGGYTDCDSRWWNAIDNCEAAGVVVTFSAGNEGPGAQTIGSPPDRATTEFNVFSIGAVDATNFPNFPYPIASFSSRGPTGCNVVPLLKIKPEVSAPGVDVYSSIPGGGYSGSFSGTSMAGPHVAGIVGLMREANPNLDVDTIKQIIMETSRDEGAVGEDNTYGWGMVDAYAACIAATVGFADIAGHVGNASFGGVPIQGVEVKLLESGNRFFTNASGDYSGAAAAGFYTVQASHPSFQTATANVSLVADQLSVVDFNLTDIAGPTITNVTNLISTTDTVGPYAISATVQDFSTVTSVSLFWSVNGGVWNETGMLGLFQNYSTTLPGHPADTRIDYYVQAEDGIGLVSTSPATAPAEVYSLIVTELLYAYNGEDPNDANWTLTAPGDVATTGRWTRVDPIGTNYIGLIMQPEDDHTPNPGVKCFITGNNGTEAGDDDVDNGCTTLTSPAFDLAGDESAIVSYWRWYAMGGASADDELVVDVSSNNGSSWVPLERTAAVQTDWEKATFDLADVITLTSQVRLRFIACDINVQGLTEAGIDDFALEVFTPNTTDVQSPAAVLPPSAALAQNHPNPVVRGGTTIQFVLSNAAQASMDIYDASGRRLRRLVNAPLASGAHSIAWDGRDDNGRDLAPGVYFYRLTAGEFEQSRRLVVTSER